MSLLADVLAWFGEPAHWSGPDGAWVRLVEHVTLSAVALALAVAVAVPLGLWLGHRGRGGFLALAVTNVGRAVPTFALLAVFSLTWLGFGNRSVVLALVLFGIPPILANTYSGMRGVDRETVEAARGMGLTGAQTVRRVELPLAAPLLLTGVRLAAVQIVATLTIAALVAGPGLGRIVSRGVGTQDDAETVAGALLVVVLALAVDAAFGLVVRRVRRHTHTEAAPHRRPAVATPVAEA